jgi:hypothetical protein
MDDYAGAVSQATVKVAGFRLGERRPENLNPVEDVSNDHSISPSVRRRDDNAALSAEQRIGHRDAQGTERLSVCSGWRTPQSRERAFSEAPRAARIEQE